MDSRRRLASLVLDSGWTVAEAARESGVSRQAAHTWVGRARKEGLIEMSERSRRPLSVPRSSPAAVVDAVMEIAGRYPDWGPKKLHALLWPHGEAPVCARTVARILFRAGRKVSSAKPRQDAPLRFERELPNELWQVDFKRVGHHRRKSDSLSVVDDACRFCLSLRSLPDQTLESAWGVLWSAFEEHGLPLQVLSDNGPAFRNNATWRWSGFDLRLMLLGIRPTHGRPYHPQTQGKVERFHGTLEREVRFEPGDDVQQRLGRFRDRYNWERPHEALAMRTPGSVYRPSPRRRPSQMPEPFFPDGAIVRRCSGEGVISYKGQTYKVGKALAGLPVGIQVEDDVPKLVWGTFVLAPLPDLKV